MQRQLRPTRWQCDCGLSFQTSKCCLLSSTTKQNDLDRLKHNDCVENKAVVLDIEKIVLQLLSCIFDGRSIGVFDLGPACQPRSNQVPLFVIRNFFSQLRYKMWTLRSWTNKTHF